MPLDASTAELIEQMAASGRPPIWHHEPDQLRANGVQLIAMYGAGPDMHSATERTLAAFDRGEFRVRTLLPRLDPMAVIVYYHGGGWVLGTIDEFDTLGRKLAAATGCAVVMVEYRKAPEHPYPAAVEDAWTALSWVEENLEAIAGQRVPILVAGDSAGGNLAAVMALRARDRNGPRLAMQVLVYPATDCDLENPAYLAPENQVLLHKESVEWFWGHYLPDVQRRNEPEASPLRSESLVGLPPAVVLTAEYDPLRAEGEAYRDRLADAGVPVQHKRFDGQSHGFFTYVNVLPGSEEGIRFVADAIARGLDEGTPR